MEKYVVLEKAIGETPLSCAEAWRAKNPKYADAPLAYAGRLDPMASGKLLVLIGEECKKQTDYHSLDKEYEFSVLCGISSDTGDILGRLTTDTVKNTPVNRYIFEQTAKGIIGKVTLPYPLFSSKTVQGKALHTWTLEDRLDEIEIPTRTSTIYELEFTKSETISRQKLVEQALEKVNSIPPVTDLRKAIGNDFRREDVRRDWNDILNDKNLPDEYLIAHFRCVASSGTYMRTLAKLIADQLDTVGLAWHIHRTKIGNYDQHTKSWPVEY